MSDSRVALGLDRLPWLPDEPVRAPRRRRSSTDTWLWLVAATLLVAAASYWLGMNSWHSAPVAPQRAPLPQPQATVRLPEPVPAVPQPEVRLAPMPQVEPIVAPPMPVIEEPRPLPRAEPRRAAPQARSAPAEGASASETQSEDGSKAVEQPTAKPVPQRAPAPQLWPVRVVEGASGRLIRVGTFSTAHRAKKGWWAIVRMNPTLKRFPALVVPVQSLRDGRVYYRLQMGTTSQAHSTVLCQRMRMIGQSCVVIDERRGSQ